MTDFLSRLVDRVLGHAPVAKPLIAPHFAQGAEIFGSDATPFTLTQTESFRYGDEQTFDIISSDALPDTSSMLVEETQSPGLKHEEAESGQQLSREQQPAKVRSTPAPRSDIEEDLTLSLLPDRAAEDSPSSMTERERDSRLPTRASPPPVSSPATEPKPQQPARTETRDLSAGIEPLQSEKEVQQEIPQQEVYQQRVSPLEISQPVQKPGEVRPADEMRKDMPLSEREPSSVRSKRDSTRLEARSTEQQKSPTPDPGSYSDTEEEPTSSSLSDRAAENPPASLTRREGEPISPTRASPPVVVSRVSEQKPKQPPPTEAHDLSADIEPLRLEKEVQREIPQREVSQLIKKPVDETRKEIHLSEREPSPVRSTKDSARLEQQKSLPLRPDNDARQIERPSSVHPSDARITKQRTSNPYSDNQDVKSVDGKKPPARQAASISVEDVVPVPAVPVEYDSGGSRIVRPERITPRGRADSPSRATTANTKPNIQTAPTIKVTIGRIEVRAVLPPPAPREQDTALPAPRMSLDDYLKSVSGERR